MARRYARAAVIFFVFLIVACTPPSTPQGAETAETETLSNDIATQQLQQLFADEWSARLAQNPLFASRMGVADYNDRLPDMSPDAQQRNLDDDLDFLARLDMINRSALSQDDQENYDLFKFIVGHRTTLAKYQQYKIPILSDSGFHMRVQRMYESMPFASTQDYEKYLSRLKALGPYFEQNIENMRDGLADGFTQPKIILEGIVPSISGAIVEQPTDSIFYSPFNKIPAHFSDEDADRLRAEATSVISNTVLPAYTGFLQFFIDEYMPGARDTLGASSLENGKAYYEDLTRFYTTLDDATPESIHEIGLQEVARIRAEMEDIIRQVEFDGTFAEFIEFLRTDPQFYVDEPKQLLKEASYIAKRVDGQMPAFFRTMPRLPYGVQPVPDDIAPNYTTGRYWGAPIGGRRGGYYMVNTYALDKRPLYTLAALTVHEGVPGHHHQSALRQEIKGVPDFRRAFYPHAFGEGWGLYTEKLAIEMNIYETPYDDFGRLSYEMWRAVRLVIDTGMHYKGWSRERAQNFLADNSALSLHNVRTEVDRYISWPGQALAYKMGELKILELRARAEQELGDKFDIRDFHDAVLMTGGVPLDMLEQEIERFIEEVRSSD
jgi:uncharacterized protein (DUF885 family)